MRQIWRLDAPAEAQAAWVGRPSWPQQANPVESGVEATLVRAIVIKGHLVGPSRVELDEPLDADALEVEVIAQVTERLASGEDGVAS